MEMEGGFAFFPGKEVDKAVLQGECASEAGGMETDDGEGVSPEDGGTDLPPLCSARAAMPPKRACRGRRTLRGAVRQTQEHGAPRRCKRVTRRRRSAAWERRISRKPLAMLLPWAWSRVRVTHTHTLVHDSAGEYSTYKYQEASLEKPNMQTYMTPTKCTVYIDLNGCTHNIISCSELI